MVDAPDAAANATRGNASAEGSKDEVKLSSPADKDGSGKTNVPQSPTLSCEDSSQNYTSRRVRQKLTQFVATSSRHEVYSFLCSVD